MKLTCKTEKHTRPSGCTPPTERPNPSRLALAIPAFALSACLAFAAIPNAWAKDKNSKTGAKTPTKSEVAEKKSDLKEIRGQIESLRKDVATAENKRANAADQLKEIEQDISSTQRDLLNLSMQRSKLQETLNNLATQSRTLETRLNSQQAQLEKLIYRQYVQGTPDSLRLLLNGDNPNQMARDMHYLTAIGQARSDLMGDIDASLQRKKALAADTQERAKEMAEIEAQQKKERDKLVAQREQRKQLVEKISATISAQRKQIGNLERDEKQLSQLIDRLSKALAAKPAPRPVPPRKKPARTSEPAPTGKAPSTEIANDRTPEAVATSSLPGQQGNLRLPTRGVVTNRFGASRQEGGTWKGLFIRANPGSEVKSIASGRIVFADWMRGFGNLIIVDHGGSYLSIYGNNDALLKQVGDTVKGGDTIASVGNSGGNPESGLYFELRHQGRPLDPMKWVNIK